jgi:hypothetical protein
VLLWILQWQTKSTFWIRGGTREYRVACKRSVLCAGILILLSLLYRTFKGCGNASNRPHSPSRSVSSDPGGKVHCRGHSGRTSVAASREKATCLWWNGREVSLGLPRGFSK